MPLSVSDKLKRKIEIDLENAVISDVLEASTVYSPKGRRATILGRESYGLSFCADGGRITYTQDGESFEENKHHAVLLPQNGTYSLVGEADGSFPVLNFLSFTPLGAKIAVFDVKNPDFLKSCYEEILRLFAVGGNRAKIMALFYEILGALTEGEGSDILSPALSYLEAHLSDPTLSNARLAAEASVSEVYFRRLFKQRYGRSPKQYILHLRLQKAAQLLSEGRMTVRALSLDCGFESEAHFCRYFKESYGMTPSEYRKKHQTRGI